MCTSTQTNKCMYKQTYRNTLTNNISNVSVINKQNNIESEKNISIDSKQNMQ